MTTVNVRYMVDDVEAAVAFYTTIWGLPFSPRRRPLLRMSNAAGCVCY